MQRFSDTHPTGLSRPSRPSSARCSSIARYALARAGLAMACADMYLRLRARAKSRVWGERTETEARAALDLDADLAEAHLARAAVARKREFDWNTTMTASRRALVLNPNLDQARFFMSAADHHLGYMEEALIEMNKGRRLRGGDVIEPIRIEALVALFSGNFGAALAHLQEVSRLSSQAIGDTYLALAVLLLGERRTRADDARVVDGQFVGVHCGAVERRAGGCPGSARRDRCSERAAREGAGSRIPRPSRRLQRRGGVRSARGD